MRKSIISKLLAVAMIAMLLTSFMVVGASAAVNTATAVTTSPNATATTTIEGVKYKDADLHAALKNQYDVPEDAKWSTKSVTGSATKTEIFVDGSRTYVYTSAAFPKRNYEGPIYGCDSDIPVCMALQSMFGATSSVTYSLVETDECKYLTSISVDGEKTNVYVSQKPSADNISVSIKDGKLDIGGLNTDDTSAWNQLFSRMKGIIVGITGIGTLVMIVMFILQFMKLGASAGNPTARSQALMGVLWTGIAAALLGSVTIVTGFFYNAI